MYDVFRKINKETVDHIKYRNTVMTGEVTAVNSDGTYNVKIAQAGSAYPNIETLDYNANFSVGEIVDIAFEYGNRELPKIMGTAKKIAQEPSVVEVDYTSNLPNEPEPEPEIVIITGDSADGNIYNGGENYNTAWESATGMSLYDSFNNSVIGQIKQEFEYDREDLYHIYRDYWYFNTSDIPSNSTITKATITLYCWLPNDPVTLVIQNGQPDYPHNPLQSSDFDKSHYSGNGGSLDTIGWAEDTAKELELNSNGIAWINKTGMTKLCLRVSNDIAGIAPTGGEIAQIYTADSIYPPTLTITYQI
jgi:hypothetical protein